MAARHYPKGTPVHEAEARGIRALVSGLPDHYVVYSNIELPTGQRGQTYEHDAVVVAPHAVFTVELKSWGGTITGNRDRWTLEWGDTVQSPLPLLLAKARSLKGRLQALRRDFMDVWVQGLVFLSNPSAVPHITPDFAELVTTPRDVIAAITDPNAFGRGRPMLPGQATAVHQLLNDGKPTRAPEQLGGFVLKQRLAAEERPYESWLATRGAETRVLHVHVVTGEDAAERERSRNHALREATLHEKLRGGPDVLGYRDYFQTETDPQRIVLVFDDTTPLVPSDVWVRDRAPGLVARLSVAARAARALAWVHARNLVHRRLSPEAILVSGRSAEAPEQVRLAGFDLARDLAAVTPTILGTALGDPSFRCVAPEVLRQGEATAASDRFSLGAALYELLSGRALFATAEAVLRPFSVLPFDCAGRPVPDDVLAVLTHLLQRDPSQRCASAEEAADKLDTILRRLTSAPRRSELEPGRVLREVYELKRRLGRGATATTWLAENIQSGTSIVLKIASAEHAALLQEEHRIGFAVSHPNLVKVVNVEPFEGGNLLVLGYIHGVTAAEWAAAGDPLDPPKFKALAEGLLGALSALHAAGWIHRDVKPENVMMSEPSATPTLVDLGLAAPVGAEGGLAQGTVQYKDPLVYSEGRWTPANDQFSAFLVLYEVLTGAHPFGSAAPDSGILPAIEPEQFPDSFPAPMAERLAAVFRRALSPQREDRPASPAEALADIAEALGAARPARPRADAARALPPELGPDSLAEDLPLSTRAKGALARLAVLTVGGLAVINADLVRKLPNVGNKTTRELCEWAELVRARWPALSTEAPPALERFYPPLADDERALGEVDLGLNAAQRQALEDRGIRTVGDLARLPRVAVATIPTLGRERRENVRRHMARLSGREAALDSLDALDALLAEEIGERSHEALAAVVGLRDGAARSLAEAGERVGVSRQRVHQVTELEDLRRPGHAGHLLLTLTDELLPAAGFATLDDLAGALALRLPVRDPSRVSALGYARLGALLLSPEARASQAAELRIACRAPWTPERLEQTLSALGDAASWPPLPRPTADTRVWDGLSDDLQRALVRWGADAAGLLDALLRLDAGVRVDRFGALYTPPVPLRDALARLRPLAGPAASASAWVDEATRTWEGVSAESDIEAALLVAGLRPLHGQWVDPARVEVPAPVPEPTVDPSIPRQRAGPEAAVVRSLCASAERGGVRVVAMPPGQAHRLGRALADWLGAELGRERVRFVDVDRVLIDAVKQADYWAFVPAFEAQPGADWRWIGAEARAALDDAMSEARPGLVTVLGKPALLGTLGLMDWLGGFYERARGGRHGLVVLAIPGGVHDDRVRLNERYNLPCTPDMAAVYLEGSTP